VSEPRWYYPSSQRTQGCTASSNFSKVQYPALKIKARTVSKKDRVEVSKFGAPKERVKAGSHVMKPEVFEEKYERSEEYVERHRTKRFAEESALRKFAIDQLLETKQEVAEFNEELYRAKKAARKNKGGHKEFISAKRAQKLNKRLVREGKEATVVASQKKGKSGKRQQAVLSVHMKSQVLSSVTPYQALGKINQDRVKKGKSLYSSVFIDEYYESQHGVDWYQTLDAADAAAVVSEVDFDEGIKTRVIDARRQVRRIKRMQAQAKRKAATELKQVRQFEEPDSGMFASMRQKPRGGNSEHPNKRRKRRKQAEKTKAQEMESQKNLAAVKVRQAQKPHIFKKRVKKIISESGDMRPKDLDGYINDFETPFRGCQDMVSAVGPTVTFIYQLCRSRNVFDGLAATYQFYNVFVGSDATPWFKALVKHYLPSLSSLFATNIEAESWSEDLHKVRSIFVRVCTGEAAQAVRNLVLSAVSAKLFSKDVSTSMVKAIGKPPKMDVLTLLDHCFNQLVVLMRVGESLAAGVPYSDVLMSKDPVAEVTRAMKKLIFFQDKLYTGYKVEGMMDRMQFLMDAKKLIALAEHLEETQNPITSEGVVFMKGLLALKEAYYSTMRTMNCSQRQTPYGILLYGDPGIGKGLLTPFILGILSAVKGREFDVSHMYNRVESSDYFEGYQQDSHMYLHYSELGSMAERLAMMKGDPMIAEICSIIDTIPKPVDMAFEGKGKTFANFEAVIADCNDPSLNLGVLVNNPAAIKRRFIHIEPSVKPEFRLPLGVGIDPDKSMAHPSDMMDRWTFRVTKYFATNARETRPQCLLDGSEGCDIWKLVEIISEDYKRFLEAQTQIIHRKEEQNPVHYMMPAPPILERQDQKMPESEAGRWFGKVGRPLREVWTFTSEGIVKTEEEEEPVSFQERFWNTPNYLKKVIRATGGVMQFAMLKLFMYSTLKSSTYQAIGGWSSMVVAFVAAFFVHPAFGFASLAIAVGSTSRAICGDWVADKAELVIQDSLHREMDTLFHLLGIQTNPRTVTAWWARNKRAVATCLGALAATIAVYRLFFKKSGVKERVISYETARPYATGVLVPTTSVIPDEEYILPYAEAKSHLTSSSEASEVFHRYEESFLCGYSRKRVPVRGHELWNVMVKETKPCSHQGTPMELLGTIERNIRQVCVVSDIEISTYLLGLKGGYALINTHALGTSKVPVVRVSNTGRLDALQFFDTMLTSENRLDLGNDVSLVCLSGVMFRDITVHLSPVDYGTSFYDGAFFGRDTRTVFQRDLDHTLHRGSRVEMSGLWVYSFPEHWSGACGLPLIIKKNSGSCIVGLHSGGIAGEQEGYATRIDGLQVLKAMSDLSARAACFPIHSEGALRIPLEEPVAKSPFRHEVLHGVEYLGKVPGPVLINKKSRLVKSEYSEELEEIFDELLPGDYVTYSPPLMVPMRREGEYISPYNIALRKISAQKKTLNHAVLKKVIGILVERIVKGLAERGVTSLCPLTLQAAVNGAKDDPFIKRVNVRTSAGFGLSGTKEDHLPEIVGEPELLREPTDELLQRLAEVLKKYENGECSNPVFMAHLKDEAREICKALSGKTRVFYASPLVQLLLARMMLSPFYSLMVEYNDLFCCAVGINMHSGSDEMVRKMQAFSKLWMEGDYKSYDTSMPFDVGHAASTLVYEVLKRLGYSEEALRALRGVLTDQLFPLVLMNLDLFRVAGLQPSGKYATAEDNSLRGLIMLMYVWYTHPRLRDLDFFQYVLPNVYGDDMLAAVKEAVAAYFNNIVYSMFCMSLFAIEFTPAQKSGVLLKFLSVDTCSFLKRRFVYREDQKMWTAPLEPSSILRSLVWSIPSRTVTQEEQVISALTSALWELALHFQAAQFETISRRLCSVVSRHVCNGRQVSVPSFNEIWSSIRGPIVAESRDMSAKHGCDPVLGSCVVRLRALHAMLREDDSTSPRRALVFCKECGSQEFSLYNEPKDVQGCHEVSPRLHRRSDKTQWCENAQANDGGFQNVRARKQNILRLMDETTIERAKVAALMRELQAEYGLLEKEALHRMIAAAKNPEERKRLKDYAGAKAKLDGIDATLRILARRLQGIGSVRAESGEAKSTPNDGAINLTSETENVVDVAGGGFLTQHAGQSNNSEQGQQNVLSVANFLSRPVEIYRTVFTPGDPLYLRLSVWDLFTLNPAVRAKLKNFAYLRANMHIRVAVSGTPFHYGRLLVSAQPYADFNANLGALLTGYLADPNALPLLNNYLSQAPGSAVINVNENVPTEIVFPFICSKPMFRLFNTSAIALAAGTSYEDLDVAGDLFITSLNVVKAVGATATPLYLQVYAWMEDVQLGTNTATRIAITTESGVIRKGRVKDERVAGPVEVIASRVAQVSRALTSVPLIGTFAEASTIMADSVRAVAAIFGWSKPVLLQSALRVKHEPFQNGAVTIGTDTATRIVLDECQELTVDPRVLGSSEDEMTIDHIASRNSYLKTFTWADTDDAMAPIAEIQVCPIAGTVLSGTKLWVQPTACSFAAAPFYWWRGDMTYRFDVVCSAYHRGKLAFAYEPNAHQESLDVTDVLNLNKKFIRIIDIQETQTFELTIPWAHHRAWARVPSPALITTGTASMYTFLNGYIFVVPFTELQSPDSSDISINIFVRCDNLQVNGFTSVNVPTYRSTITGGGGLAPMDGSADLGDDSKEITAESGDMSMDNCVTSVPITNLDLNPSTADNSRICEEHFGEQPLSFRALIKRYVQCRNVAVAADSQALPKAYHITSTILPPSQMPYNGTHTGFDLFSYLRYAYVGIRGGVRVRPKVTWASNMQVNQQVKVSLSVPGTSQTETQSVVLNGSNGCFPEGTATFIPTTNGGIEVELPFYTSNLFLLAFLETWTPSGYPEGVFSQDFYRLFKFVIEPGATTVTACRFVCDYAAAEDFSFLRFQGAPYHSLS